MIDVSPTLDDLERRRDSAQAAVNEATTDRARQRARSNLREAEVQYGLRYGREAVERPPDEPDRSDQ